MSKINLYNALKNSYSDRDKQKKAFVKEGYVFDSDLSDNEKQVYYNPKDKKLLYTVKGTNPFNLRDIGTDIYLGFGHLKDTNRFKEAQSTLNKAKKRYHPSNTVISGHSLGGSIAQYIAGKNDKVYTLDKGATIGQKTRSNENAYRTQGDLVSIVNANSTRMRTLKNPHKATGFLPIDILKAHDVNNIKGAKIFI